jgi:antitoxin ParD1/3/4
MHISLPQPLKQWVEKQVAKKGFGTASEYIREMLRREQQHQETRRRIDDQLIEGLASGPPVEMTANDWAQIRKLAKQRSAKKRRS